MTVESLSFSRTTPKIVFSVSGSTFAVDSSKTMIVFRCNSTRAVKGGCRSPLHHFLTVRDQVDRKDFPLTLSFAHLVELAINPHR